MKLKLGCQTKLLLAVSRAFFCCSDSRHGVEEEAGCDCVAGEESSQKDQEMDGSTTGYVVVRILGMLAISVLGGFPLLSWLLSY